jgi:mono/diheme cytochrome c family protein
VGRGGRGPSLWAPRVHGGPVFLSPPEKADRILTRINDPHRAIPYKFVVSTTHKSSSMTIRTAWALLVAFTVVPTVAKSQEASISDDVQQGHRLANAVCGYCHVAAPDQDTAPLQHPPAPSFESIAQRDAVSADSIRKFLTTTHRGISSPGGMPSPQLLDFQIRQVAAYIMSLRNQTKAPAGP